MGDLAVPEGAIAQLGERLLCKQEVVGSIPSGSTNGAARRIDDPVGLPQWGGAAIPSAAPALA